MIKATDIENLHFNAGDKIQFLVKRDRFSNPTDTLKLSIEQIGQVVEGCEYFIRVKYSNNNPKIKIQTTIQKVDFLIQPESYFKISEVA